MPRGTSTNAHVANNVRDYCPFVRNRPGTAVGATQAELRIRARLGGSSSLKPADGGTAEWPDVDQRLGQIREANEHLVVVAVPAQALTEEAEWTSPLKDGM